MSTGKATTEHFLFGLAVLLAAGIRFINLGSTPLSDGEATWALQALDLVRGSHALIGPQPAYILLTAFGFSLLGISEFLARFWPALAGSALVLAPVLFRERIGRKAAVVLAFALALEPSLVAASRQADGRILALAGLVFATGFWLKGSTVWAGIAGGFALLGGPTIWNGLIAAGLGWSAVRVTRTRTMIQTSDPATEPREARGGPREARGTQSWRSLGLWVLGTVLVLGTLFWFAPTGLSGWANSLAAYLQGWVRPDGTSLLVMLIAWIGISPLAVLFGLTGFIQGLWRKDPVDNMLAWLWIFAFLLFLVYPGREPTDLAWSAIPLLASGARAAVPLFHSAQSKVPVIGYTVLSAALAISGCINLIGLSDPTRPEDDVLRWTGILGAVILILASFLLMTWGWSLRTAWEGGRYGLIAVLVLYSLSATWSAAGLGARPENEIWHAGNVAKNWDTNLKVIGDVSEWSSGRRDTLNLVVSDFDTPSLRWALRDHYQQTFSPIAADAKPQAVITPEIKDAKLILPVPYTGQALVWSQAVQWNRLQPREWLHWFIFRELPARSEAFKTQPIILWLRSDLFPGAAQSSAVR